MCNCQYIFDGHIRLPNAWQETACEVKGAFGPRCDRSCRAESRHWFRSCRVPGDSVRCMHYSGRSLLTLPLDLLSSLAVSPSLSFSSTFVLIFLPNACCVGYRYTYKSLHTHPTYTQLHSYTLMSQMTFFILIGIGIDDMFIIVDCFDRSESHPAVTRFHRRQGNKSTIGNSIRGRRLEEHEITTGDEYDDEDDVPLRLAIAMEEAGPSVTLTSLTDCLAFAVGSLVEIPAISFFCRTSACAIASVFVIQTTFFAGCLVLDERRVRAGMYDVFPCCSASTVAVPSDNKGDGEMDGDTVEVTHIAAGSKRSHRQEGKEDHHRTSTQSSLTTRFLRHVYVPFLEVPFIKVCVVLSFIALAAFSAYTGQHIEKGLETTTLLGTGSEVRQISRKTKRYIFALLVCLFFSADVAFFP